MKKITAFTHANLETLRVEIQDALNAVAAKHGIVAGRLGRIGFQGDHFKASVEFSTAESSAGTEIVDPKLFDNMKRHGFKIGFSVTDIGKPVEFHDLGLCKIVGMAGYTKVAVQTSGGKIYRCDPVNVKRLMAAN